jgi:hypothetical protein
VTHLGRQIPAEKTQFLGGKFKKPPEEFQKPRGESKILPGFFDWREIPYL